MADIENLVPVVLCGGSGTRLWPLSRELFPKQLLALVNDFSLLQNTLRRLGLDNKPGALKPLLICNEEHRFMVAEQMRQIGVQGEILLEPAGRNTAPAVTLAALNANPDDVLVVLPSDHVIENEEVFSGLVVEAVALANAGKLVTFGIVPDKPETGYGYIRKGKKLETSGFEVDKFVEKPGLEVAQQYLDSGEYLWNSGMFVFKAGVYLQELARNSPAILEACKKSMADTQRDMDFVRIDKEAFESCPSDSIDYAVMEHTDQAAVIPFDAGWSDVGSWAALAEIGAADEHGNVITGESILVDSKNNLVHSDSRLVTAVGLEDHVIVETADAILVAHKGKVQEVKKIVEQLKSNDRPEAVGHRRVQRPWGYYETIDIGDRYQVKRIGVNPGSSLSLQMHHHRAEHWIVVSGTAMVTRGDDEFLVSENESTYIPLGTKHRLYNPGKTALEMIEVQSGSYLGEDDIVRFEDSYGRE